MYVFSVSLLIILYIWLSTILSASSVETHLLFRSNYGRIEFQMISQPAHFTRSPPNKNLAKKKSTARTWFLRDDEEEEVIFTPLSLRQVAWGLLKFQPGCDKVRWWMKWHPEIQRIAADNVQHEEVGVFLIGMCFAFRETLCLLEGT